MVLATNPEQEARLSGAAQQLCSDGYVILEHAVSPATLDRARADLAPCFVKAPLCDGLFYGYETKRFGRLLSRLSDPDSFVLHSAILSLVRGALGDEAIQLNLS